MTERHSLPWTTVTMEVTLSKLPLSQKSPAQHAQHVVIWAPPRACPGCRTHSPMKQPFLLAGQFRLLRGTSSQSMELCLPVMPTSIHPSSALWAS